ncbi:Lysine-specific permease [Candidatus Erwinia haradaeae]|uniref:Lysine-specific permease n=1 Tax=Candidatus Erwinia haradaeae TaxID=1922217 RepID=A0A451DIX8_9GAMM|nr:amino acid permease [Candidatus Erwinia haradaeae]VFP86655.1 Lysine-specific permease [Candidatus Erwinia haradaeae]
MTNIQHTGLKRELKTRNLMMMAIGGSIGTGLFVASGATIAQAGPGGALVAYALIGLMVYFLMTSLGELASFMPVSGSFSTYGSRYVEEGFGFALGWNYWYNWAITIAVDLVAAQLIMSWWFPDAPGWIWSTLFLGLIFLLNNISVRNFSTSEYWLSLVKVATVILFIVVGIVMILHALHDSASTTWKNWTIGDAPFVGGFSSIIGVAMIVGFSFQGTELIGIAAGESVNPQKSIPKAVRQVFWRILLFYVLAIIVISIIIPYTDPNLLKTSVQDISISPFTLVFQHAGLLPAAAVMNVVILTAVLSSGNSGMYSATRMLFALASDGKAPRIFANTSKTGIPRTALYATTLVAGLCFLTVAYSKTTIYLWLLNASGVTGFIAWLGIAISHYRFRKGYISQGRNLDNLPYRATYFPVGPIFAFIICLVITFGQHYQAFCSDHINWHEIAATYIGIPLFLCLWMGFKIKYKSRFVKYSEMSFPTSNH